MAETPDNAGFWRVADATGSIVYQRIYPTKVSVDIKYKTAEQFKMVVRDTHLCIAQVVHELRDNDVQHMRHTISTLLHELLSQLPSHGHSVILRPKELRCDVDLSRTYKLSPPMCITINSARSATMIEIDHAEGASDAFLADQIVQGTMRAHDATIRTLYDGNLLQDILVRWKALRQAGKI